MPIAVKVAATRCMVKLLRKLPADQLPPPASIEALLPSLVQLIADASLDCVNLPIEALTQLSKQYESQVTSVA